MWKTSQDKLASIVGKSKTWIGYILDQYNVTQDDPRVIDILKGEAMEDKTSLVMDLPMYPHESTISKILIIDIKECRKLIAKLGWKPAKITKKYKYYSMTPERWKDICDI